MCHSEDDRMAHIFESGLCPVSMSLINQFLKCRFIPLVCKHTHTHSVRIPHMTAQTQTHTLIESDRFLCVHLKRTGEKPATHSAPNTSVSAFR